MHQNERMQHLLLRAKVLGLSHDLNLPENSRRCLQQADAERRHLNPAELELVCAISGTHVRLPQVLQDQADELVEAARHHLLQHQPELTSPGGALHPRERADACWRDCWNFMRVITYAIAAGRSTFTDPDGMRALRELYTLMGVPIDGMTIALNELQRLTLQESSDPAERSMTTACFEHLLGNLNKSAIKS